MGAHRIYLYYSFLAFLRRCQSTFVILMAGARGSNAAAEWPIKRVVVGDGSRGPSGARLDRGRFYGSAVVHGGQSCFDQLKPIRSS